MTTITRVRHKRSKYGCNTCKSRRLKCDEVRPRCNRCTKSLLSWPQHSRTAPDIRGPHTEGHEDKQHSSAVFRTVDGTRAHDQEKRAMSLDPTNLYCVQQTLGSCDSSPPEQLLAPCSPRPLFSPGDVKPSALQQTLQNAPDRLNSYGADVYRLFVTRYLLDTSPGMVHRLFASYLVHVHIWYPIFYVPQLEEFIEDFIARHNQASRCSPTADYAREACSTSRLKPSSIDLIVCLILSLGEMCLHARSIMSIDMNDTQYASQTQSSDRLQGQVSHWTSLSFVTQCARGLPGSSSYPTMDECAYSAISFENAVVPTAFYLKEPEHLSNQPDHGNDLLFAQSYLLLGLRNAHKAGIEKASEAFTIAGDKLHDLLDQFGLLTDSVKEQYWMQEQLLSTGQPAGIVALAATSCPRLENVNCINANPRPSRLYHASTLPLPFSSPENPTGYSLAGVSDMSHGNTLFRDHVALVILERQLHQFCRELEVHPYLDSDNALACLAEHREALLEWRRALPEDLQWEDNGSAASSLIEARLRAKYYETTYKIYAPYLQFVLHILPHCIDGWSLRQAAGSKKRPYYREGEIRCFEAMLTMSNFIIYEACNQCIEAAFLSASAYYMASCYTNPLNSQDIAYPMYEIIMVLFRTYQSPDPNLYIDVETLRPLFENTVEHFQKLAESYPFFNKAYSIHQTCLQCLNDVLPTWMSSKWDTASYL